MGRTSGGGSGSAAGSADGHDHRVGERQQRVRAAAGRQEASALDADLDAEKAWDITTGGLTPAGDTIVILLPVQATEPQLALADGPSIALEREADWYRSAKIELQAGSPEFLVTPSSAADRSRFAAGQEAKAKAKAGTLLRIRLTVD